MRSAFSTPRLAEFATKDGLVKRTGSSPEDWAYVVVKEIVDNAIDVAEEANQAPVVRVDIGDQFIRVEDEGPGFDPDVVSRICDYDRQTSSRAVYVVPSRGAQGNAIQSILPMGFALGGRGVVEIESKGVRHEITFSVDPVRGLPQVTHGTAASDVKCGARVTVHWPSSLAEHRPYLRGFVQRIAWLNPHLAVAFGGKAESASDPGWRKWPARNLTPHWYDGPRFRRLLEAQASNALDNDRSSPSIGMLVREFDGLSSTAKARAITNKLGLSRKTVEDVLRDNASDAIVLKLLAEMQAMAPKPDALRVGCLGRKHLALCMQWWGAGEKFEYRREAVEAGGLPYVIETAFGYRGGDDDQSLLAIRGLNFSPTLGNRDPFNPPLRAILAELHVDQDDPVVVCTHIAAPRFEFIDFGKTTVTLPHAVKTRLQEMVAAVTRKWTKQKLAEIRDQRAKERREERFRRKERPMNLVEALRAVESGETDDVMTIAFMAARGEENLPVQPRQVFYKARPMLLRLTGRESISGNDFGQRLLVDYMNDFPERTLGWDIAWKVRGNLHEPHGGEQIGLGTLEVRRYLAGFASPTIESAGIVLPKIRTSGAAGRYMGVLDIEKEGFMPLIRVAEAAERHDIAVVSNEGMPVVACRAVIDELCGRQGLPLFVMHDFDVSGFSIQHTNYSSNRRYQFRHEIKTVVDFGLRLEDVERLGLAFEEVPLFPKADWSRTHEGRRHELIAGLRKRLASRGANAREIDFLTTNGDGRSGPTGKRVELNAMSSPQFVAFIEEKLASHGRGKVIPDVGTLADAYRAFVRGRRADKMMKTELERINQTPVDVPFDLVERVREELEEDPALSWDKAVETLTEANEED